MFVFQETSFERHEQGTVGRLIKVNKEITDRRYEFYNKVIPGIRKEATYDNAWTQLSDKGRQRLRMAYEYLTTRCGQKQDGAAHIIKTLLDAKREGMRKPTISQPALINQGEDELGNKLKVLIHMEFALENRIRMAEREGQGFGSPQLKDDYGKFNVGDYLHFKASIEDARNDYGKKHEGIGRFIIDSIKSGVAETEASTRQGEMDRGYFVVLQQDMQKVAEAQFSALGTKEPKKEAQKLFDSFSGVKY